MNFLKLKIPALNTDAMQHSEPYLAKAATQQALGYPEQLVENWQAQAVSKMGELLEQTPHLQAYLDNCVHCGACSDKCHYFLGTGDPKNMPVARQDLFRQVYRRYFTFAGKYFPRWVGARDFDENMLNDWYRYFHQCSQCRRCAVFCPFGIDTADIAMAAREILNSIGTGQRYTQEIILKVENTGNNLGLSKPALQNILQNLEEDLFESTGCKIRLPLNEYGAEVLLIPPSADFFAEPHVDGFLGYAKVFYQAGISWTLCADAAEAGNFALFSGSETHLQHIATRIRDAAATLGVRRIVFGECGHAWRVAHNILPPLLKNLALNRDFPVPQHICEFSYDLLQRGALRIDKTQNAEKHVSFHDSCNIARASQMGNMSGGQFTIPRALLMACCAHFHEMPRNTTHENTFCCGGGGGLLSDELMPLRIKGALPRIKAFQSVIDSQKVTHLVTICAICKTQLSQVFPHYGLERAQIISLHQLIGDALVIKP